MKCKNCGAENGGLLGWCKKCRDALIKRREEEKEKE